MMDSNTGTRMVISLPGLLNYTSSVDRPDSSIGVLYHIPLHHRLRIKFVYPSQQMFVAVNFPS